MSDRAIYVTKASGDRAIFSEEKLRTSLRNAGAESSAIDKVIEGLLPQISDGMSTRKIYRLAFSLLRQHSGTVAARYQLKKAIMDLGTEGFLFEHFVCELFSKQGYHTQVGVIDQGKCITHEIDVLLSNDTEHSLVECKYHSLQGKISDVKVPLYIHSRFNDLKAVWQTHPSLKDKLFRCFVVTNTRFSPDAEQYGRCASLELVGWDYPSGNGIREMVSRFKLYPITCLTKITRDEKDRLLANQILFCDQLIRKPELLEVFGVSQKRLPSVLEEAKKLSC